MLRGVWGAALRSLDYAGYHLVFTGETSGSQQPGYVIRPASADPEDSPALDWFLLGDAADGPTSTMLAWEIASQNGLGPERVPFRIRRVRGYGPGGELLGDRGSSWLLSDACWPLHPSTPCRLRFEAPLRMLRRGKLIDKPTLLDLVIGAQRRIRMFLGGPIRGGWDGLGPEFLSLARSTPTFSWRGGRHDLHRYSGRQKREIELRGVSGVLDLPDGPGVLWPLLAAARWTHLGKGTTVGLGEFSVEKIE